MSAMDDQWSFVKGLSPTLFNSALVALNRNANINVEDIRQAIHQKSQELKMPPIPLDEGMLKPALIQVWASLRQPEYADYRRYIDALRIDASPAWTDAVPTPPGTPNFTQTLSRSSGGRKPDRAS